MGAPPPPLEAAAAGVDNGVDRPRGGGDAASPARAADASAVAGCGRGGRARAPPAGRQWPLGGRVAVAPSPGRGRAPPAPVGRRRARAVAARGGRRPRPAPCTAALAQRCRS